MQAFHFFDKVQSFEILLFTKHLSTMIKAGIPISRALTSLEKQTKSDNLKKVLRSAIKDVENGRSLGKALGKFDYVFSKFYLSLVEIGEQSGELENTLNFLAIQLAKDYNLKKKIQSAMLYPGVILTSASVMGSFVSFYILPKLLDFFTSFEIELPLSTKILIWFAGVMKNYNILIIASIIVLLALMRIVTNLPAIKPKWHALLLKIPIFGKIMMYHNLASFARNLGTLLKSGVPIANALASTADTLTNLAYKNSVQDLKEYLIKGKKINEAMNIRKYEQFPPVVVEMIAVGEQTGRLDETLLYLADFYEDEIDNITGNLATLLEPVLLLAIGLIVAFVAMAIISPIYKLTGSISR